MKCPKCGYPLPEDSLFCQYCGARIESQPTSDPPAEEVEAQEIVQPTVPVVSEPISEQDSDPVPEFVSEPISEPEPERRTEASQEEVQPEQAEETKNQSETSQMPQEEPVEHTVTTPVVPVTVPEIAQQSTAIDGSKQVHCKVCGAIVDNNTKKCTGCGKQYFRAKTVIPRVVVAIVLILSICLNVWQYIQGKDALETVVSQTTQIEELEKKVESLNSTVSSQKSTISSQKTIMEALEVKSEYFDTICKELSSGNIGYAASNFRASESVIVVDKDETNRKFTLTANWSNGGTVEVDYSGSAAFVSFDEDSWYTSTKITVEPWREGVTAVTFSNDVDSRTFKVLIIVTE